MESKDFTDNSKIKFISNSASLERALTQKPKTVILNCFEEQSKNDFLVQSIITRSPESKIITIGKEKEDFRKNHTDDIVSFLPKETSYNGMVITLEQLIFSHQYGETYTEEEININSGNSRAGNILLATITIVSASVLWLLYNHF